MKKTSLKKVERGRLDKIHILILVFLNPCSSLPQQLDVQNLSLSDLLIFLKDREKRIIFMKKVSIQKDNGQAQINMDCVLPTTRGKRSEDVKALRRL